MPYVALRFDVLLEVLLEPFYVSNLVGDYVVSKRVYSVCFISLSHGVTLIDLVELYMLDFDVVFCMDCLHHAFYAIDCRTRVVDSNSQMSISYS